MKLKNKLIIAAIVIAGVTVYVLINSHLGNHVSADHVHQTYTGLSHVQQSNVIDKQLVVEKLKSVHQLVGLESTAEKHMIWSDSIFENHGMIKDFFGNRTIEMIAQAHFKMGINLSSIQSGDIVVYGQTLFIKLSKEQMQLISLSLPFDQLQIREYSGLFRLDFSLEDKQYLYGELRKIVEQDIIKDENIINNTYREVSNALQNLMSSIPKVTKVVIQERLS